MDAVKFRPGRIVTDRILDADCHNVFINTKLPFVRWPGRERMPEDYKSREFRDKTHDAVDAFVGELDDGLKDEGRPALLRLVCLLMELHQLELIIPLFALTRDQRQFYVYAAEAVTKLFITENWLSPDRDLDPEPASSKQDGKRWERNADTKS